MFIDCFILRELLLIAYSAKENGVQTAVRAIQTYLNRAARRTEPPEPATSIPCILGMMKDQDSDTK